MGYHLLGAYRVCSKPIGDKVQIGYSSFRGESRCTGILFGRKTVQAESKHQSTRQKVGVIWQKDPLSYNNHNSQHDYPAKPNLMILLNKLLTFGNDLSGRDEFRHRFLTFASPQVSDWIRNFSNSSTLCTPAGVAAASVRPRAAGCRLALEPLDASGAYLGAVPDC